MVKPWAASASNLVRASSASPPSSLLAGRALLGTRDNDRGGESRDPEVMSHFGLCRLEAAVFAWNPRSMRVLEHCGFVREGISRASVFKDGEVTDRVVYALVELGDDQ